MTDLMTDKDFEKLIMDVLEFSWSRAEVFSNESDSWLGILNRLDTLKITAVALNINFKQFDDLNILWMVAVERMLSANKTPDETPAILQPQNA